MVWLSAKAGPSKRAPSPIEVDDETEDEGEITPAQSKGKVRAVPKKTGGKSEARKTRDVLSQPPPLPALPDPGEGEGAGGRACGGDVRGERDSGGP